MSMGARLARERRNQNLTQEQLAEQLGVSEEKRGDKPPSPVTRLLREAVGKKVLLAFYEEDDFVFCDYARILDFDGGWANVEFVREKRAGGKTR